MTTDEGDDDGHLTRSGHENLRVSVKPVVQAARPGGGRADGGIPAAGDRLATEAIPVERDQLLARISVDPEVCFGKPCIRGRRIWVSLILDMLATGIPESEILEEYDLEAEDVRAALAYGAVMTSEH